MNDRKLFLKELFISISNYYEDSDYTVSINMTDSGGYKMIDVFRVGESRRCAFIEAFVRNDNYSLSIKKELVPKIKAQVELPEPGEIKPGRYPNWVRYKDLSYNMISDICKVLVS